MCRIKILKKLNKNAHSHLFLCHVTLVYITYYHSLTIYNIQRLERLHLHKLQVIYRTVSIGRNQQHTLIVAAFVSKYITQ
jgi:hypothetical protein